MANGYVRGTLGHAAAAWLHARPDDEEHELRRTDGRICSSFRAYMLALRAALQFLLDSQAHNEDPVVCTDSQSALASI